MERMCDSCIFRPDGLDLDPWRRDQMVRQSNDRETAIICHSTLKDEQAVCRGYFNLKSSGTLRLAQAMGIIEFDSAEGRHP